MIGGDPKEPPRVSCRFVFQENFRQHPKFPQQGMEKIGIEQTKIGSFEIEQTKIGSFDIEI